MNFKPVHWNVLQSLSCQGFSNVFYLIPLCVFRYWKETATQTKGYDGGTIQQKLFLVCTTLLCCMQTRSVVDMYEIIRITKLNIYLPSNGLDLTFIIRWALVAFTQNERCTNRQFSIYNQPAMQKMFSHFSSFLTKLRSTDVIGERKDHWFVIDFSFSYRDQYFESCYVVYEFTRDFIIWRLEMFVYWHICHYI